MSSRSDFSLIADSVAPLEVHSWLESRPNGSAMRCHRQCGAMHPDFFMGQPSFVCEIMPGSIQIGGERGFVGCILDRFVALKFVIAVLVFGLMAGAVVLVFCQLIKPILWHWLNGVDGVYWRFASQVVMSSLTGPFGFNR
ncbi:MAG: hypothetical protein NTY42_15250 [Planctomycetota bacterium]|nr:hypothetical protein [Planctomycetota bacterium]